MIKKIYIVAVFTFLSCFVISNTTEASFIPIGKPIFSPVIYKSTPTGNYRYVSYSEWGSVWLGSSNQDANILETDTQAIGTFGVGVPLSPLGTGIYRYNVVFDYHFRTWDDSLHDTFNAVITKGNYIWNSGTLTGGSWTWGGSDRGGKETTDLQDEVLQISLDVIPASDYYLNIFLTTTGTNTYPSWGRFSDTAVEGVTPEPASMLLFGIGALGFGFARRKRI